MKSLKLLSVLFFLSHNLVAGDFDALEKQQKKEFLQLIIDNRQVALLKPKGSQGKLVILSSFHVDTNRVGYQTILKDPGKAAKASGF